jgi:hypothetical protein
MVGGDAATPASNAPAENDNDNEDYRRRTAVTQVGHPHRLGSIHDPSHYVTPPSLSKFDVQNLTFNQ